MVQEILSQLEIEQIHQTSMRLLETVGVVFPCEPALAAFRNHGIRTDGNRVFMTEGQLTKALASAPKQFTIHARNPARSVTIGAGRAVFAPGYGAPFLVDATPSVDGVVGRRTPTMEDYANLVKIAHNLPTQDMSGHLLVEPGGGKPNTSHLRMLHAHMVHSDKPFIGSSAGRRGAQDTMAMAKILFGDFDDRAVTLGLINSLTPLGYNTEMLEVLVEFATAGQPMVIAALGMAGSTAPITLAGLLATQTAELLTGIALTQFINPGTPVILGSTSTNIDMRSGALALGSPELSQMIVAHAQLCRFYGLPSRSGGALTDSSYPDAQAGFESMLSLATTINSGIDFVLHAGGILSSYLAFSYEKFILDDEMCSMVRRLHEGITVDENALAYDIITNVGPGGNFLMEMHTARLCRQAFWEPAVCDRAGLEAWMQGGKPTAVDRARARWQRLVAEHQDPPLDGVIIRQLDQFVESRLA